MQQQFSFVTQSLKETASVEKQSMKRLWTESKVSDALVWITMTSVPLYLLPVELGRFFGNWEGGTCRSEHATLF